MCSVPCVCNTSWSGSAQMGNAGQMQPAQVPPNQNFLNRPPGQIPVTHGNVQPQVTNQQPDCRSVGGVYGCLFLKLRPNVVPVFGVTLKLHDFLTLHLSAHVFLFLFLSLHPARSVPRLPSSLPLLLSFSPPSLWWWAWLLLVRSQ